MSIYLKKLRNLTLKIGLMLVLLVLAFCVLLRYLITPVGDEWATKISYGIIEVNASIPAVLRLATSPLGGFVLHNRAFSTRFGRTYFQWNAASKTLSVRCEPCLISMPEIDAEKYAIQKLEISVQRFFTALHGSVTVFEAPPNSKILVQGNWSGTLTQTGMVLDFEVIPMPIANWYLALVPFMPELKTAQIKGTLGLVGHVVLPQNSIKISPEINNFEVHGLNIQSWLHAPSRCGANTQLHSQSWLARGVIAAEDQGFFTHPGYDIEALNSVDSNHQTQQKIGRDDLTITQQLVRNLITGSEHTISRQLRELLYVVEMEKTLGKNKILQLYLNNVPWGKDFCGAHAAAYFYFGRAPEELSPVQAAWLAALLHNPEMELEKWRTQGEINRQRLIWVIYSMQGTPPIGYVQRNAWLHEAQTVNWLAPSPFRRLLTP